MKFRDKSLTLKERIADLLERLTIDEKIHMLSNSQEGVERLGINKWSFGTEAARGFVSRENGEISTVFPQPIGMASTFDKALMRQIGEVAANEARYYHMQNPTSKLMMWGPTVDMERNSLWGRTEEGYGEDTCLAGEMTCEYTIGLAGCKKTDNQDKAILDCTTDDDGVLLKTAPALKHFCANNNEHNRMSGNSAVSMKLLHDYYYRAFKPALTEGGACSVMTAYNKISGVPGDMNPDVQNVLKNEWNMDFAVSDGGAFSQNVLMHKYVKTHAEALAMCIKNGTDTMTDNSEMVAAAAYEALKNNLITEADIDKAVGNVLIGRFRLGEFDDKHKYSDFACQPDNEQHRSINRKASYEQICLLKNNGLLPLKLKSEKILITGPIADEIYADWYTGTASYKITVKDAFEAACSNVVFDNGYDIVAVKFIPNGKYMSVADNGDITFTADEITLREKFELHMWDENTYNFKSIFNNKYIVDDSYCRAVSDMPYSWFIKEWFKPKSYNGGVCFSSWHDDSYYVDENSMLKTKPLCRPSEDRLFEILVISDGTERIVNLSNQTSVTLYCAGNHPMQVARECYDRSTLALPFHQHKQIMSIQSEKLITMIIASYPYAVLEENAHSAAMLYSSHCGAELGNAVCDTIFGFNNPAARCPLTWYKSDEELSDILDYDIISSKSTYMYYDGTPLFEFGYGLSYSEFEYDNFSAADSGDFIKIDLNVTNISDTDGDEVIQIYYSDLSNPNLIKRLCGFERVNIKIAEKKHISFDIPKERISSFDSVNGRMNVFSGEYVFMAGASSQRIYCKNQIYVKGNEKSFRKNGEYVLAKYYDNAVGFETAFSKNKNDWFMQCGDWGGKITFNNCSIINVSVIKINAAAPCAAATIEVIDDITNNIIASFDIPPSQSPDDFTEIAVHTDKLDFVGNITLNVNGMAAIYNLVWT